MNLILLAQKIVSAQTNVVKYERGNTYCPVCKALGLPIGKIYVTCTIKEVRYCTCEQCSTTFRAIGDEPEVVKPPAKPPVEPVKSPVKADKKRKRKHNKVEDSTESVTTTQKTKETKDDGNSKKQKRNKRRTRSVSSSS